MGFDYVDLNKDMQDLEQESTWHDFHSVVTIQLGELIQDGWDWGKTGYPCIDEETRTRLNQKIEDRYFYRELCTVPPGKFKLFIGRKLREIMPKYNELYKLVKEGRFDLLETGTGYGKSRNIFSDYPQSQLQGSADYATNANDTENKAKSTGSVVSMMVQYQQFYNDIDVMVVDELDSCFSSLSTINMNSF